jgi:hypothetical protein
MTGEPVRPCPKPSPRGKKPRKALVRTRMKRKPPRRLKGEGSDKPYLAWLHKQPCVGFAVYPLHVCRGGIQASHLRHHTGLGLKEPDRNAVPMCREFHEQWEQHRRPFNGMSNETRFAMFMHWVAATQAAWSRA